MGYINTLHLFNDTEFYRAIVPALKDSENDIREDCLDFLRYHILGGIKRLSDNEIDSLINNQIRITRSIANSFDSTFKIHKEFNLCPNQAEQSNFMRNLQSYDDFCQFVQYMIFKYCSDFYPQLYLGKGSLYSNIQINTRTLSSSIISELDGSLGFFACGQMGITSWINSEEVELLYLDKENLNPNENIRGIGFLNILEIANQNKLGIIACVDLSDTMISFLPKNKLITNNEITQYDLKGINIGENGSYKSKSH